MLTEQEEFLPHGSDGKKKAQFTDVSTQYFRDVRVEKINPLLKWSVVSDCLCSCHSLKGRRPLECQSLTSVMPSWEAGFWDWHMPCQTLALFSSCKCPNAHTHMNAHTPTHMHRYTCTNYTHNTQTHTQTCTHAHTHNIYTQTNWNILTYTHTIIDNFSGQHWCSPPEIMY